MGKREAQDNAYVTVRTYAVPFEAEMARARLESAGIEALILSGGLDSAFPTPMSVIESRLQVPSSARDEADRILGEGSAEPDEDPDDEPDGQPDDEKAPTDDGDAWMRRSAAGAVFGFIMFPPLLAYSAWILLAHGSAPLSASGRRRRAVAVLFTAVGLAVWIAVTVRLCG